MVKTEAYSGLKYHKRKGMKAKDINENTIQTLAEDFPSYTTPMKGVAEFNPGKNSTEDKPRSGCSKTTNNVTF